jgi:predicted O-methyltransferase YrrM
MSFNKEGKEYTNDWFDHQLRYFNSILEEFKGKDVKFLEVGSWEGRSTCWMLDNILTSKDSSITCIDSWQGGWEHSEHDMAEVERRFLSNISENSDRVEVVKALSKQGLISIHDRVEHYDFIYIDAGHTMLDVMTDGILAIDLLKPGGIMAFDDYGWGGDQPKHLVPQVGIDALVMALHEKVEVIATGYQIWIRKK